MFAFRAHALHPVWLVFLMVAGLFLGCATPSEAPQQPAAATAVVPFSIPVVVIQYFPVHGQHIDRAATGDWGESLAFTRAKTDSVTRQLIAALEDGSRFRGYANPDAPASLAYQVVETFEWLEPLPTYDRPGREVPMTDYRAILERIDAAKWVETHGVREFWIWGYHGGVLDLWESNMAGPHGDISNSNRDTTDLPIFDHTYTVYHYNYQRGTAEAMENHMHQLEHVLNHFDGRDVTPFKDWPSLLFWGHFVGSDSTHTLRTPRRAGWSHYPPNAERDYHWDHTAYVLTDIEDWQPDSLGRQQRMNCTRWQCDHLQWFIYWTQSIPGHANGLRTQGRPLRNWWQLLAAFDEASEKGWTLVE